MTKATFSSSQLALDLRRPDSPLTGSVKGDRNLMVFNFFSLKSGRTETELPVYDDGRVRIEVTGTKHGVANIWDKEILIYCASLIVNKLNKGEVPEPRLRFTPNDFFRVVGGTAGGSAYKRFETSLTRLKGTLIKTNIETGGQGDTGGFGWIDNFRIGYVKEGKERIPTGVEVWLCDWLFRAIVRDNSILTYNKKYFELSPLDKRLYEVARSGPQQGFRISLPKLYKRTGCTQEMKYFKAELAKFANHEKSLPDFGITLTSPHDKLTIGDKARPGAAKARPGRIALTSYMVGFYPTAGSQVHRLIPTDKLPVIDEAEPAMVA